MRSDFTPEFLRRSKEKIWKHHEAASWLNAHNHRVTMVEAVSEVGSGLNGRRPKLLQLLANPEMQTIVVEPRDR